jgi:ribulose-phosphate 3-epimerase
MIGPARIAPSILAADFARLGDEVARVAPHVDMLHIDVMDGHFVPNIAVGIPVIESLRPVTDLTFDCHLMVTNPEAHLDSLRAAGADLVTVHIEVHPDPTDIADQARALGLGFGLVVNPPTPFGGVDPYLEMADMLLVMSVHPGFGGQQFMDEVLDKVEQARKTIDSRGLGTEIEMDGGIDPTTIRRARDAGAEIFVAGTAVFRAEDPAAAVMTLLGHIDQERDAGTHTRR